jgi:hypothetical protein
MRVGLLNHPGCEFRVKVTATGQGKGRIEVRVNYDLFVPVVHIVKLLCHSFSPSA